MVSVTSARPSGGRDEVPAKTTSSIRPLRRLLTPCSPMTQERASTTFDLPDPFGPTTQVMPGSRRSVVAEAKDLNPRRVRFFRYTGAPSSLFYSAGWPYSGLARAFLLLALPRLAVAGRAGSPAPYRPAAAETANC